MTRYNQLKRAEKWPIWLAKCGAAVTKPFGVSLNLGERKPRETMKRYLRAVTVTELHDGFAYIDTGRK